MPSTHSYQLTNPSIEGTFNDIYDAKTPLEAADKMWINLSSHFMQHLPKFYATLKNISSDTYHHFEITENGKKKKYTISTYDIDVDKNIFNNFLKSVDNYNKKFTSKNQMSGGKRKSHRKRYSSSSSSSSSSDYPLVRRSNPIALFHYMPYIYYRNVINPPIISTPISTEITSPIIMPSVVPVVLPTIRVTGISSSTPPAIVVTHMPYYTL